jgi:hypothetical protein
VKFGDSGELIGNISFDEFKKGYGRLVTDVALGNVTSRLHNKAKQIEGYISKIEDKPDLGKEGSFNSRDVLQVEYEEEPEDDGFTQPQNPKPQAIRPRKRRSIISSDFIFQLTEKRIIDVYDELRILDLDKHSNSISVLLRVFLEMCIGNYLEKTDKISTLLEKERGGNNPNKRKPNDWYPTLRQMLTHLNNQGGSTLCCKFNQRIIGPDNRRSNWLASACCADSVNRIRSA